MSLIDPSTGFGQRVERRLAEEQVIWLTTVRGSDGTPQPSPVWFLRENDSVMIYSKPDTPKIRNIEANPRVALSFNATPSGGDVVVFTGEGRVYSGAPAAADNPAFIEKYRDGITSIGMTPESFSKEYSAPIRVQLAKLRGF